MKICYKCSTSLPRSEFHVCKRNKDGLQSECKKCSRIRQNARAAAKKYEAPPTPEVMAKRREASRLASEKKRKKDPEKYNADCRKRYWENLEKERARSLAYRLAHPEKMIASRAAWRAANQVAEKAAVALWKKNNKEKTRETGRIYRESIKDKLAASHAAYRAANKEKIKKYGAAYTKANAGKVNASTARRYSSKRKAIPSWACRDAIERIYIRAAEMTKETGSPHEVDHIVPLQSSVVCGLHCESNLRVLTRYENRSKSNNHWPDMP